MKGIVFLGDKKLEIQDFDDPSPGPDDVIIEIKERIITVFTIAAYSEKLGIVLADGRD